MVAGPMGMLEEAIREHLELRRLHGADPSELARDEQAALGPAMGDVIDRPPVESWPGPDHAMPPDDTHAEGRGRAAVHPDALYASQETAELDMSAILGIDLDGEPPAHGSRASRGHTAAPSPSGIGGNVPSLETELDRLDWEVSRTRPVAGRTRRGSGLEL
jgi:hypothetical protein